MTAEKPYPILVVPRLEPEHLPADRLTVAVFGPGHGEAVLVALPDGRLGVLDGCAEHEDPVVALIERIDVARGGPQRLAFVGLTHPHEDHFAGLGHLLDRHFDRTDAWWDTPIGNRHAKALFKWEDKRATDGVPLPSEWRLTALEKIVDLMHRATRERGHGYKRAGEGGKVLLKARAGSDPLFAKSVGPCDADVYRTQLELVSSIRRLAESSGSRRGADPNFMSAAIVLRWGKAGVLLTGDLLNQTGSFLGWTAAENDPGLEADEGPIQVVKCAHHASEGAHHDPLWDRLSPRLALVTPFKRARTETTRRGDRSYPPRPEQIARLTARCPVVITSPPLWPAGEGLPRPRGAAFVPPPEDPHETGARTDALAGLVPGEGRAALNNAVAVTLDAAGEIVQVVLAGEADFYAP